MLAHKKRGKESRWNRRATCSQPNGVRIIQDGMVREKTGVKNDAFAHRGWANSKTACMMFRCKDSMRSVTHG